MNLDDALQAHSNWRNKLTNYCMSDAVKGSLNPDSVGKDDQCDLGKWIHSDGKKTHGSMSEFTELSKHHAEFHKAAADIIRLADENKKDQARQILGDENSSFRTIAKSVTTAIVRLKLKIK